jgi:flagellar assembly factor FliW
MTTIRFGEIDVEDSKILKFPEGIPGLDWLRRFTLITSEDTKPFLWFQSVEGDDVALPVINPLLLFPDYSPWVPERILEELHIVNDDDVLMLSVVVIPRDVEKMTCNLCSPLIVNIQNNTGRQVILENSQYNLREPIFERLTEYVNAGGGEDAEENTADGGEA